MFSKKDTKFFPEQPYLDLTGLIFTETSFRDFFRSIKSRELTFLRFDNCPMPQVLTDVLTKSPGILEGLKYLILPHSDCEYPGLIVLLNQNRYLALEHAFLGSQPYWKLDHKEAQIDLPIKLGKICHFKGRPPRSEFKLKLNSLQDASDLEMLTFESVIFYPDEFELLLQALPKLIRLRMLTLNNCQLNENDLKRLIEKLEFLKALETLNLRKNLIGSHSLELLAELICKLPELRQFDISAPCLPGRIEDHARLAGSFIQAMTSLIQAVGRTNLRKFWLDEVPDCYWYRVVGSKVLKNMGIFDWIPEILKTVESNPFLHSIFLRMNNMPCERGDFQVLSLEGATGTIIGHNNQESLLQEIRVHIFINQQIHLRGFSKEFMKAFVEFNWTDNGFKDLREAKTYLFDKGMTSQSLMPSLMNCYDDLKRWRCFIKFVENFELLNSRELDTPKVQGVFRVDDGLAASVVPVADDSAQLVPGP